MIMDTFVDRLSEYLDGELSPAERASIDGHLAQCADCRATLDELRHVIARAAAVQDSRPQRDLWPAIAARIGGAPRARVSMFTRALTSRLSFTLPQLAAASLALMVLSGGLVWMAKSGDPRADFQPLSADTTSDVGSRQRVLTGEQYDQTIAQLEKRFESSRADLDPDTLRVLDRSIAETNRAIEAGQRALAADPANADAKAQVAKARQRKLSLLRLAVWEVEQR
jgi:anti-sigma factor RsiW